MKTIQISSPRNWTPKRADSWVSPYSIEQYTDAQKGAKAHPLQPAIEQALDVSSGESHQLNFVNAPSGCAPDVAAFLSGEPDAMLDCEFSKAQRGPVKVYACIATSGLIESKDVATHIAKIAQAVYSVGLVRPVTVQFYVAGRISKRDPDTLILLPEFNSFDCIDAGLLALIADPRTAREFMYGSTPKFSGTLKWPSVNPVFNDGVNIKQLTSGDKPPSIEQLITLINGD